MSLSKHGDNIEQSEKGFADMYVWQRKEGQKFWKGAGT